jgi:hypothetical protein
VMNAIRLIVFSAMSGTTSPYLHYAQHVRQQ